MIESSVLVAILDNITTRKGPHDTFKWPIYEEEEDRLTQILGVDFKSFDIGGTYVTTPQLHCGQCDKISGFDDFIHEALTDGIHSEEFVLRILKHQGSDNVRASPPHRLKCMNCNIYYRHSPAAQRLPNRPASFSWSPVDKTPLDSIKGEVALMGWASGFGWTFGIKERDEDRQKEIDEEYNAMKAKEAGKPAPTSIERDPEKVLENGIEHWDAGTEEEKRVLKVVDPKRLLEEDV